MQHVLATSAIERKIAEELIATIIDEGFLISVDDGEALAIKRSRSKDDVLKAMFATEVDTLIIRNRDGEQRRVGSIVLIYGNGNDVIADYADVPHINRIVERTMKAVGQ